MVATLVVAAWATTSVAVTHAETTQINPGVRIHRYAAFNEQAISDSRKRLATTSSSAARRRTQVNVYGKQLALSLENNTQLTGPSFHRTGNTVVLRGTLEGMPNSWVRLTQVASGTHGLIWDGNELYAVEPSAEVRDVLANSLPAPDSTTVIFKLSDTTVDLGGDYCASPGNAEAAAVDTGLAAFKALTADLAPPSTNPDSAPKLRLEMQVLADAAFRAEYNSDQAALDAIMVRLNNVDGIYSAQMGLQVQATDIRLFAPDPAALSTSTNAETLLSSLGQMRASTSDMNSYAATHLFTGRDLDGDTLGIAYIGNICGARYAASLSEIRHRGAWIDSLVTAHELGHQLGAVHDGTGMCAGTAAQSYLMSAFINGTEELSQCSRESILATMQYAACLVPVGTPDIGLVIDKATLNAIPDASFKWTLSIQNSGTDTAAIANVHIDVPTNLLIETGAVAGGSCTTNNRNDGGTLDCQLDAIGVNEIRQIDVTLRSAQLGNYLVNARAATERDDNTANNQAQFTVIVSNDVISAGAASNAPATAAPSSAQHGGGGTFNLGWLLIFSTIAGRRLRLSNRRTAYPLH